MMLTLQLVELLNNATPKIVWDDHMQEWVSCVPLSTNSYIEETFTRHKAGFLLQRGVLQAVTHLQ
jgi:hypothetical protein